MQLSWKLYHASNLHCFPSTHWFQYLKKEKKKKKRAINTISETINFAIDNEMISLREQVSIFVNT